MSKFLHDAEVTANDNNDAKAMAIPWIFSENSPANYH